MSWVYFPKGVGSWPAGTYQVSTEPYLCDEGKVVVYRGKDNNDLLKVDDEWGLCNFGFLPFKVAFNLMWLNWLLYAILLIGGLMLFKNKKYGTK